MNTSIWQPDITVAAICEKKGSFLMVEERAKSSGKIVFNQPAGHLEANESIVEAVVRETAEETCYRFQPLYLVGIYRLQLDSGKCYIRFSVAGTVEEPDPDLERDSDIIATHWLNHEQIRNHSQLRSTLVLRCVDDYLAGNRYSLDLFKDFQ